MRYGVSMDWKSLITELMGAGLSQREIGEHIGLSQSAVSDLVRGRHAHISWERGQQLIALHAARAHALPHPTARSPSSAPAEEAA